MRKRPSNEGDTKELEVKSESQRKEVTRMSYPTTKKDIMKSENEVATWSFGNSTFMGLFTACW